MTVAHLKERMDACFKAVDKRFDAVDGRFDAAEARFDALDAQFRRLFRSVESLGQKVGANTRGLADGLKHCDTVLSEHDKRIQDLEPPRV